MRKTSSSLPDSYPGLSGSFFINTSSSGRAGCHSVTGGLMSLVLAKLISVSDLSKLISIGRALRAHVIQ